MAQGDLGVDGKRHFIRLKIGEVGELRTREARAKVKELLGQGQSSAHGNPFAGEIAGMTATVQVDPRAGGP
jgi:hypothetical protein